MLIGVATVILTSAPALAWALEAKLWQPDLRPVSAAQAAGTRGRLSQQGYGYVYGQVGGEAWVQGHMSVAHYRLVRWNAAHTARLVRGWPIRFSTSTRGWWKFTLIGRNIGLAGFAKGSVSAVGSGKYTVSDHRASWSSDSALRITIK